VNLEMAVTAEMIAFACRLRPRYACLVPERREERTTEGGLDVAGQAAHIAAVVANLKPAGIRISLFIAPEPAQIEAAAKVGAPVIEIHTGAWCDALREGRADAATAEFTRIIDGAALAQRLGLEVHAGHGLDYATAETIAALPEIAELNIGHAMIGEAIFAGLGTVVGTMREAMQRGRARVRAST
jgi:pyridoxine 5-phosphate synthase